MNNSKKIISGIMAFSMIAGLTACGGGKTEEGGAATTTETTTAATTTAATVAVNTETLKADEEDELAAVMEKLQDTELENNTIKWLAHYDINPSTNGSSKSVGLEMFEKKYGGKIEYYPTTWNGRFDDLSTYVLGGEGIDFFPGDDTSNFPKGIVNGMFVPVDEYIDINSEIWQYVGEAMEVFNFGGKHYEFVTSVTPEEVVIYNKATIEAQGLDDPWDLYKEGNWNWDTFKQALMDYVDVDSDQWGLDGFWAEKALFLSAGVPCVSSSDSGIVCNINDPTVEKAMNFQYDLYTNGLVFPREQFDWQEQPQFMGEGKQLFYIIGAWAIQADPATWNVKIAPEDAAIVPVPSPAGSDPYQAATLGGYALCKGAQNPKGVALFAECNIVGGNEEAAIAISNRKAKDDWKWDDEMLNRYNEMVELARKYPVIDLATGCSTDIASITTDGGDNVGTRAALHGTDWASNREAIADTVIMLVDEVDQAVKAKQAE